MFFIQILLLVITPLLLLASPNPPKDLYFSNITQHSVTLHWRDMSNDETGFKILRNNDLIAIIPANSITYTDHNLKSSTSYTYTIKATDDRHKEAVLFAHGYQSDKSTWDIFANHAQEKGYNVFRFNVSKDASIESRATQLAKKIVQNRDKIANHSLITIGHSMGGLDLRYIISLGHDNQSNKQNIFYQASKKIKTIFTIASPHKGTGLKGIDDATKDMEDENMKKFNEKYPYSTYTIDGRKIDFLAYRFRCGDAKISDGEHPQSASKLDSDGVVWTKKQIFNGAKYTQSIYSGKHTEDALCIEDEELIQTEILDDILDNDKKSTDVKDIVFYKDNSCKGDEEGTFSSSYKAGAVRCLDSDECSDDAISSLMLYPGIHKHTTIKLYNSINGDTSSDWAVITLGNTTLDKPICIDSFEEPLKSDIKKYDIKLEYHKGDALIKQEGLDGKISYIDIE